MDHEIPPGGAEWGGGDAGARTVRETCRANDIEIGEGTCWEGSYPFVCVGAAVFVGEQSDAVSEGEEQPQVAVGVRASASAILRQTFVGQRVLCSEHRQCDRRSDSTIRSDTKGRSLPSPTRISRLRGSFIESSAVFPKENSYHIIWTRRADRWHGRILVGSFASSVGHSTQNYSNDPVRAHVPESSA
jgi:hypothetical protein